MRQRALVTELLPQGRAEVSVVRRSACSGDCHRCAGCGAVTQTVTVQAENVIRAQEGDWVYIESGSAAVLGAAVLVYLLPLLLLFAGYFCAAALHGKAIWFGAAGFAAGLLPAFWYDRRMRRKPPVYRIVELVE